MQPTSKQEKRRQQVNESSRRCKERKRDWRKEALTERDNLKRQLGHILSEMSGLGVQYQYEAFEGQSYGDDIDVKRHTKRLKRGPAINEDIRRQRKLEQNRLANKRKNSRVKIDDQNLREEIEHLKNGMKKAKKVLEWHQQVKSEGPFLVVQVISEDLFSDAPVKLKDSFVACPLKLEFPLKDEFEEPIFLEDTRSSDPFSEQFFKDPLPIELVEIFDNNDSSSTFAHGSLSPSGSISDFSPPYFSSADRGASIAPDSPSIWHTEQQLK